MQGVAAGLAWCSSGGELVRCGSCGYDNRADSVYCGQCRAALTRPCPACGDPAPAGAAVCPACGVSLTPTVPLSTGSAASGEPARVHDLLDVAGADAAAGSPPWWQGGDAGLTGVARDVQQRQHDTWLHVDFRIERHDPSGNRLPPVPVEMRGPRLAFRGRVSNGDEIRVVDGRWQHGTLHVKELDNLTTGAKVQSNPYTAPRIGCLVVFLAIPVVFLAIFAAIIVPTIWRGAHGSPSSGPPAGTSANPAANPSASVDPASGAGGAVVRVSGSGFPANARVDIDFYGDQLGITTTNGHGEFSNVSVTIPTSASDNPGKDEIDVTEESGAAHVVASFTVPSPAASVDPASGTAGTVVRVSASDFPRNARVEIDFEGEAIGEATTDRAGKISNVAVTIPAKWGSFAPGEFDLDVVVESDRAIDAQRLFTVTG